MLMNVEKECTSVNRSAKTQLAHIHVVAMIVLCSALMEDLAMVRDFFFHYINLLLYIMVTGIIIL